MLLTKFASAAFVIAVTLAGACSSPAELAAGTGELPKVPPAAPTGTLDAGQDTSVEQPALPMPSFTRDFDADVEPWWATHPFNPRAPGYVPVGSLSASGPVTIDVQARFGADLQAAIDALPAEGGTLLLAAGTYRAATLLMKSHVHFVSSGGAVIEGEQMNVVGCEIATRFRDFSNCIQGGDAACLACISSGRVDDIYFKNITFDGKGTAPYLARLAAATRVVFDGCTFQGVAYDPATHDGAVSGDSGIENVWFRGCHFIGRSKWAVYLDGLHFGGVVESTVDGSFGKYTSDRSVAGAGGGLLFMTNDDASADVARDGVLDASDKLNGNHIVVAENTFAEKGTPDATGDVGLDIVLAFTATHVLVTNNQVRGGSYFFASLQGKLDTLNLEAPMAYIDLVFANNVVDRAGVAFVSLDAYWHDQDVPVRGVSPNPNTMTIGRYTVRGNRTNTAKDKFQALVEISNIGTHAVVGPNVVTGNVCAAVPCDDAVVVH